MLSGINYVANSRKSSRSTAMKIYCLYRLYLPQNWHVSMQKHDPQRAVITSLQSRQVSPSPFRDYTYQTCLESFCLYGPIAQSEELPCRSYAWFRCTANYHSVMLFCHVFHFLHPFACQSALYSESWGCPKRHGTSLATFGSVRGSISYGWTRCLEEIASCL